MGASALPPMFRSIAPPETLAPYVRRILVAHHSDPVDVAVQPAPTGFNYIGWIYSGEATCDFGDRVDRITASGLNYAGQVLSPDYGMRYVGRYGHILAETTATGFARLTHVMGETVANDAGLFDTIAHPWAASFAETAAALPTEVETDERIEIFVAALTAMAAQARPVPAYLRAAADQMAMTHGTVRISDLVNASKVGQRHFTREFTQVVGVSPKVFCLIQQVNHAIALWQAGDVTSLTDLAHAAGYYDQPHLNRSFRRFFSGSPGEVLVNPRAVLFEFLGSGVAV